MSENEKIMYEQIPAVADLNKVDGFDPRSYMRKIEDGKLYLDVQFRMLWFRLKYPDGKVTTHIVNMTDKCAVVEAKVYLNKNDPDENYISNAMAQRWFQPDNQVFGDKYVECAETAAIGRSLARAGFGLQFCDVDGEKDPVLADSPLSPTTGNNKTETNDKTKGTGNTGNQPPAKTSKKSQQEVSTPPSSPAPNKPTENPPANNPPSALAENQAPPKSDKPYDVSTPVEEILNAMTLAAAKEYVIDVGIYKGKTLGQIAVEKPSSLTWYVETYKGPDNILRAAAKYLISASMKQAS